MSGNPEKPLSKNMEERVMFLLALRRKKATAVKSLPVSALNPDELAPPEAIMLK